MAKTSTTPVAELREALIRQRYNLTVVQNYCLYAGQFVAYLQERDIALDAVTPELIATYLRHAARRFRIHRGRAPAPCWTAIPRSAIHALLRTMLGGWPPEPPVTEAEALRCREVLERYERWLCAERGLADASVAALMWEARHFCAWRLQSEGAAAFARLTVRDVDAYMTTRTPGLARKSVKDVAERLRGFLRHLHRGGCIPSDLSPQVIAPLLYAYEGIPSILTAEQIAAVLDTAGRDASPQGLRDHAVLRLLATYGLRSGEIVHLRLEDIDWRADALRVRRLKSGTRSVLPLLAPAGDAVLRYLRHGRPETEDRVVFVRTRAPYRRLSDGGIYGVVRRGLIAAGVEPAGKRGPHVFRHARAVSLLRASIPRKVIGDVLGHRSAEATLPYLKLASEDLRAVALDLPAGEVRS